MHCTANQHRNPSRIRTVMARSIRGWTVAALFGMAVLGPASADPGVNSDYWVTTWGSSPSFVIVAGYVSPLQANNQTIRQIGRVSHGGNRVRVRLENTFGTSAVMIGAAHVAIHDSGSGIIVGTDRVLTFGGSASIAIAPEAAAVSDPVDLDVPALTELAVSIYLPQQTTLTTTHTFGVQTAYFSAAGDFSSAQSIPPAATTPTSTSRFFLSSIEVSTHDLTSAIVTLGDSITEGVASTVNANHRWPDRLADRLAVSTLGQVRSVVNEGIGGNRVLHSEPPGNDPIGEGIDALGRFDRDVLAQTGVGFVILLEGINDIGYSAETALGDEAVTADQLIQAYRQLIARAHLKRIKIIGATLTPFKGSFYYSADGEDKREALNTFIRSGGEFDGVIDFDLAVRDPSNPTQYLPSYQSGDWLHPNDAGYQAMANAINLRLFDTPYRDSNERD
jgi:lysophospholipase L1-like esterase